MRSVYCARPVAGCALVDKTGVCTVGPEIQPSPAAPTPAVGVPVALRVFQHQSHLEELPKNNQVVRALDLVGEVPPEPGRCLPALRAYQLMVSVIPLDRMGWTAWLARQSPSGGHYHLGECQAGSLAALAVVAGARIDSRVQPIHCSSG